MDNGDRAAFAYPGIWHPSQECFLDNGATGLTKREYFAAMAMSALLTNYRDHAENGFKQADFPHFAVIMADALLAELAKEQT